MHVSFAVRFRPLIYTLHRLFGFLLGSTLAGASVYYYILEEYKVSNELLTEDIYVRLISFAVSTSVASTPLKGFCNISVLQ